MKLFLVLAALAAAYCYGLMHTTDIVLAQTKHLQAQYQYMADNSDRIVTGQPSQ
jgi:hypothetical protein